MLEKSCGWWLIWYFLFFCHGGAEGQLQWVVKEKITDYGQDLTLFCPVENCCSKHQAGWFVGGKSKILDVKTFSNDPNSKYHGTYNTDGIGFVIRNLSEADLNVTYHCNYGFNESTPTLLRHGDVFKENVPDKDKDKENNPVTIVLSIVGAIVVIVVVVAIIIVYRRKNKRQKSKGIKESEGTKIEMKVLKDSDNKAKDQPGSATEKEPLNLDDQQDLPTVDVQQSSYYLPTGKNVQWQGSISGSITSITSNTNIEKYSGSTTTTPSLTILNASSSDAGTSTCCAISDVGTGQSTTTTLSVTENSPPKPEEVPLIVVDVYRVCVNFTDILYTKQLDDGNSNEFKSLAENLQKELTELFVSVPGKQVVVIVQFKYIEDSLLTIFDLMSWGYDKESVLRETIEKPLRDGRIGSYQASLEGFTFRSFSVVYRVDVTFTDILYPKQLDDGNSNEFKSLAGNIQTDLTKLFLKVPGKQVVIVQFIEDSLLTFDLTSWEYYGESVLRETIEKPLKDGIIGRYKASLKGFTFRAFRGDFHGAIVEKYRTKPKIPKDLLNDQEFLSKLLEECGKNTEGLLPYSSGEIDVVYFPATLLVVVMKCRPKTEIVKEVVKDMFTTLKSQPPSTVVIVYHRSVKTAMEKVPEKERKKHILEEFIEDHKFDYSASPWLHQFMDCLKKNDPKV